MGTSMNDNNNNIMEDDPFGTLAGLRNESNGARSISTRDQGTGSPYSSKDKATSTIGPRLRE